MVAMRWLMKVAGDITLAVDFEKETVRTETRITLRDNRLDGPSMMMMVTSQRPIVLASDHDVTQ